MRFFYWLTISFLFLSCYEASGQKLRETILQDNWVEKTGYKGYTFPTDTFNVLDFGARNDGVILTTQHIQKALDACAESGGGVVSFPAGKYLTGSIFVKNNTHLLLSDSSMLLGSYDLDHYPEQKTRIQGTELIWPVALVNVNNAKNVKISGNGVIHGHGRVFWAKAEYMLPLYLENDLRWIINYDCKRPRMVVIDNSSNVVISGLTLKESPFWTVHILYSEGVTVDGVTIRNATEVKAPSSDGIDIDSSTDVLVQNCDIDCHDDNFCIKSGRDADGLRVNRPTEYVVIRNNKSRAGSGLITFGSETSGGMNHIYVSNMQAEGTARGIRFKTARTRGGIIENILIENIEMQNVARIIEVLSDWNPKTHSPVLPERYKSDSLPDYWKTFLLPVEPPEKGICYIRNVEISHLRATGKEAFFIDGDSLAPVENFFFEDIDISSETSGKIKNAKGWKGVDVNCYSADKSSVEMENCMDMENFSVTYGKDNISPKPIDRLVSFGSPWTSPFRVDSLHPCHLINNEKEHLLILNKTAWLFFVCDDPVGFLKKARSQGVNVIRVCFEGNPFFDYLQKDCWPWGGTRQNPDFITFNEPYWDEAERRIKLAGEYGIGINFTMYLSLAKQAEKLPDQQKYWSRILDRFSRYANILNWEIMNEYAGSEDFQDSVAFCFVENDPWKRPVITSDGTADDACWPEKKWMGMSIVHTCTGSTEAHDLRDFYLAVARNTRSYGKPAFNNETGRENRHKNNDPIHRRKQAWIWYAAGCHWTWHSWEGCEGIDEPGYNGPGQEFLKPAITFFRALPFWKMNPNFTVCNIHSDQMFAVTLAESSRQTNVTYLCTRKTGEQVSGQTAKIRLPDGVYRVSFIRPGTLEIIKTIDFQSSGLGHLYDLPLPDFTDDLVVKMEKIKLMDKTVIKGTE